MLLFRSSHMTHSIGILHLPRDLHHVLDVAALATLDRRPDRHRVDRLALHAEGDHASEVVGALSPDSVGPPLGEVPEADGRKREVPFMVGVDFRIRVEFVARDLGGESLGRRPPRASGVCVTRADEAGERSRVARTARALLQPPTTASSARWTNAG